MSWKLLIGGVNVTQINGVPFTLGTTDPTATTRLNGECYFYATRVYNAFYNDYAEGFIPEVGLKYEECKNRIVEVNDNGQVRLASPMSKRCVGIVSDSYGHLIGATEEEICENKKIPIGMAGTLWVDAEDKVSFDNIGKFICSGEEGRARVLDEIIDGAVVGKIIDTDNMDNQYRVILLLK